MSSKNVRKKQSQPFPNGSSGTGTGDRDLKRLKSSDENLGGPYADIDRLAGMNEGLELGPPAPDFLLSWRLDPDTSFSDWTVVIEEEGGKSASYHVHKCVLAAGNRKSDYFRNVFRSGLAESLSSTSNISLQRSAAAAFPVMLDYMYNSGTYLFAAKNIVPLRY
jgi:hypothetical protein